MVIPRDAFINLILLQLMDYLSYFKFALLFENGYAEMRDYPMASH